MVIGSISLNSVTNIFFFNWPQKLIDGLIQLSEKLAPAVIHQVNGIIAFFKD